MKLTRVSKLMAIVLGSTIALMGQSQAQKYGGTINLGMYSDLHTPDLHRTVGNPTAQMGILVAEGLVDYDKKCDIAPGLAESWDVSPKGDVYTFHIRKGVKFHNGRELTAEDVKKNMEHFLDKKTRSPRRGNFKTIKKMEVTDRYTIKMTLKKPDAGFLVKQRPLVAFILAPESFETKPPHPIGTGAFEFVEWKPKQHVKLKRNKNYWKKHNGKRVPFFDEAILRPITDATARYTALRTGDIDWIWTLPFELVPSIRKNPPKGITPQVKSGARWFYLSFNTKKGPLKDVRVRRAVAYAIDKTVLMNGITWGLAKPSAQMYYPGAKWNFPDIDANDPYREGNVAKAKQLLKEAGHPNGVTLNTIVRNETVILNLATIAKAQLKKAGINLQFEVMDRAAHRKRQRAHKFDVSPSHLTYAPDPDTLFYRFFRTGQRNNYGEYNNPEYDKLVQKGQQTIDDKKRRPIYRKALELLNHDMPTLFLGHLPIAQASRSNLKNMDTNCRGDTRYSDGGVTHAWRE